MPGSLRDQCAIVGIGETDFSKDSGRSELQLACEAISAALDDAGLEVRDIDGIVRYEMDTNQEIAVVSALGAKNLRYFGQVGYGGSAHCAVVAHAASAIVAGLAEVVVCFRAANERSGVRFGLPIPKWEPGVDGIQAFTAPFGMLSPVHRFGMFARRHMIRYGTTSTQFGHVAVTMREHAQRNPRAMMYGRPMTLEQHQQSRMICDPLRLYDCCLETDGAVAIVVTSAKRASDLRQRPVYIMGAAQATGPDPNGIVFRPDLSVSEAMFAARDVYAMAGVGPADIDVAQIYDHFTPLVLMALEAYGFCSPGESGPFVEQGEIKWPNGRLPVNTHGGNLSEGYIQGLTHVSEAVRQMRGTSTCQVADAEITLVGSATAQVSSALILRR